ncbi:MAG: biopolymer transporter ExbD [Polycyclovorans sp.]|jgi:biopolymer transport protein ExbD|nr:biopolymer transporter ExbD [Polycyclovorans sp.]MBU0790045.1 biopolymer transporter ExbD [Gammaproteobacteria bacterium]MDP1543537.1 biopolymer transporter ExbD [Polycyclovorans sp.]MEC8849172.1 biopolymer transporter ExbD [Pseudomonadota bacterium]|tara:strand:- start:425 stop:835 length:411 start_codon:yes stop_codon:yes gene_type:complete
MKIKRHAPPGEETGIDLTPMLDVIFIMLIFFIVTTSFIREAGIEINRPSAETAEREERTNILIAISPEGAIWIDRQQVDIRGLRAVVQKLRAEDPQASVIVQADRDARAGLMVEVMDQARLAGVRDVAIAAAPPGK